MKTVESWEKDLLALIADLKEPMVRNPPQTAPMSLKIHHSPRAQTSTAATKKAKTLMLTGKLRSCRMIF
jgi:hypothetical protein